MMRRGEVEGGVVSLTGAAAVEAEEANIEAGGVVLELLSVWFLPGTRHDVQLPFSSLQ